MFAPIPIELARYRALYQVLDPLRLGDYPGSAWRGAFGHALKSSACTQPGTACAQCDERGDCPYPPLFETGEPEDVRPYVLEPQAYTGYFSPGALLGLDLVLFGWANAWLPLIVDTLGQVGRTGLGLRHPARLALLDLHQQVGAAGEGWVGLLDPHRPGLHTAPIEPMQPPPAPTRVRLDLLTPLKLKYRGQLIQTGRFTGRDLLIALGRRIDACATLLPGLPVPPPPEEWLASADGLITRSELGWQDTRHYSTRQHEALKLGGLVGWLTLAGPALAAAWPWLWLGQWLHLGASTTIGLGRYTLTPLPG